MKKIIIIVLLTLAAAAYSRDYEYNERRDITLIANYDGAARNGRLDNESWNTNIANKNYNEILNQSRGHEDN